MRATVDWSYRLLDAGERDLLARLAVFNGGWTLDAAEAVCGGDVLDGCAALIDASLIVRAQGPGRRFRMLEPVREFSLELLERLPDAERVRRRHAGHYADILFRAGLPGRRMQYAVADLAAAELGNLRAALEWCLAHGDDQSAVRLGCALATLCRVRGHTGEARDWLERLLAACEDAPGRTRATAMLELAGVATFQDDFETAEPLLEGVIELGDTGQAEPMDVLEALNTLAWLCAATGREALALRLIDRAMDLARQGEPAALGITLNNRALALAELGRMEEATRTLERGLEVTRRLDSRRILVAALTNLSVLKICMDELDEAEALIDECIVLAQHHADAVLHACAASNLAMIHLLRDEREQLVPKLLDALHRNERLVDRRGMIENVLVVAAAAVDDQPDDALLLYAACVGLHEAIGFQLSPGEVVIVDRYLEPLAAADGGRWSERAELGRMLDLPAATEMARRVLADLAQRAPSPLLER